MLVLTLYLVVVLTPILFAILLPRRLTLRRPRNMSLADVSKVLVPNMPVEPWPERPATSSRCVARLGKREVVIPDRVGRRMRTRVSTRRLRRRFL